MSSLKLNKSSMGIGYWLSRIIIVLLLILTFYPFVMLINMSLKSTLQIQTDFLGIPDPIQILNYIKAAQWILRPVGNSLFVCFVSLSGILLLVSLSGYAFGKMNFKGKELLYGIFLAVLMIPYTMLIVPTFWIVYKMKIVGSFLALILPYLGGQQIFGVIISRSFFASLPEDMFESARIDGAGEFVLFSKIALPLSVPILITVGITSVIAMYNDYIWPTIVLSNDEMKKTFCQIAFNSAAGNGSTDYGMLAAFFILGTIPLLIITASCLKYYLQGMLEGAIKG
jgi:ABC-type glycerol-3-phosphate transport system permease component